MSSDAALAAGLAQGAGRLLLHLRSCATESLGVEGDVRSHRYLVDELAARRPTDAILSEEGADDPRRLTAERVWIIDPLDGTREFAERTADGWRTDFAVHVALWRRGAGLVAGAVALPARGQLFRSVPAAAAPTERSGGLRLAVSRTRPPDFLRVIGRTLPLELVPMGSAGVKAMAVLSGEVDAYLHSGGQYEWDSAAPVAVAAAAGLHVSRLDGSELTYNNPDPWLPDLLVSRPEFAPQLLDAVAQTEGRP